MVDVSSKAVTERRAQAEASVVMAPATLRAIVRHSAKKGDVLLTAQLAGIQAAKKTAELIPLCHILPLNHVEVECAPHGTTQINVRCTVSCSGQTGVEMEALTGAAIAALTIYDMCKALSHDIEISSIRLVEKTGGKRDFKREG